MTRILFPLEQGALRFLLHKEITLEFRLPCGLHEITLQECLDRIVPIA